MSKHTPGPWKVNVWTTGRRTIKTCGHLSDGLVIAEVHRTHVEGEQAANADVLAVAPRLLAACKEAERLLTHIDRLGECPDTLKQMYTVRSIKEEAGVAQILRDAIALAEPGENKSEIPVDTSGK